MHLDIKHKSTICNIGLPFITILEIILAVY